MNPFLWITAVCPGFGGLITYGRWTHLVIAWIFTSYLNIVLISNFYWTSLLPPSWYKWTYISLGVVWLVLSGMSAVFSKKFESTRNLDSQGELYLEVLNHYLKGEWEKTECCAKAILRYNPNDVEVLLLLATLYRHTRRLDLAQETLARLGLLEMSDKWCFEIYSEKMFVNELLLPETSSGQSEEQVAEMGSEEKFEPSVPFYQSKVG
ncbi:MAG: tetratricopeptide repeat protein [Thermoguttaceae bacterium]|nr:tetratricopeptide repeat protein [Thermoguttaceae bacterium]